MNWLAAGLTALFLPLFVVTGMALKPSVLIVDVTVEDGRRIVAPVPLALVRAGLAFAPHEAKHLPASELAAALPDLVRLADALREAPDALLVEIEAPGTHVEVQKRGDALHVEVREADGAYVQATLPLSAAESLARAYDEGEGTIRTGALVAALRQAPRGPLVHVIDGDTEVRIRRW